MSRAQYSDLDFLSTSRLLNLLDGVSPQEPATVAQLNALVEGIAWKDSTRVATTGNINLASPGTTIDGITMAANDRVLVKAQTTGSENGLYIWNGSATPMTRSLDANTFPELEAATTTVEEGTANAGTTWRQTAVNGTIGSTTVTWVAFGTSVAAASTTVAGIVRLATQAEVDAGTDALTAVTPAYLAAWASGPKRYAAVFGDGTATSYTITHNLNSKDIGVTVYRNSGNYDEVGIDIEHTTVNSITIKSAAAIAVNALRAAIRY